MKTKLSILKGNQKVACRALRKTSRINDLKRSHIDLILGCLRSLISKVSTCFKCQLMSHVQCMVIGLLLLVLNDVNAFEKLSFQELLEDSSNDGRQGKFHQREVIIRGFLYINDLGDVILTTQPNLKTCCLDKISLDKQININGLSAAPQQQGYAIEIQGKLYNAPYRDLEGQWHPRYHLENSRVASTENSSNILSFSIVSMFLLLVGGSVFMWMKTKT